MRRADLQENVTEWDFRARRRGLHAVFSTRWTEDECESVNNMQRELIFSSLPNLAGQKVLDLGCGIGRLTASLAVQAKSVVGLDFSACMLHRARTGVIEPSAAFIQASAGCIPFADALFDVVIASYVLQHILDESLFELAIGEISRVLKIGGLAVIVDALSDRHHRPTNSVVTMLRTWEQYTRLMERSFRSLARRRFCCVEDDYTLMLWERRGG